MLTWKYKTVTKIGFLSEGEMNKWGALGWELVQVITVWVVFRKFIFKRTLDKR